MRLKLIACKILSREIGLLSAHCENYIDVTYLRQGYHDEPETLRRLLQEEIDSVESGDDPRSCNKYGYDFDAILIGYGLCSNGILGLSSKKYPLVIPRAHDCTTLFLGSKEKYREYFDQNGGTYWYNNGWIENAIMPSPKYKDYYYNIYLEAYGEENAQYLTEIKCDWIKNYNRFTYIKWDNLANEKYERFSKECADYFGLEFDVLKGDSTLLSDFLEGKWDNERFLIVPPGKAVEVAYNEQEIIKAK